MPPTLRQRPLGHSSPLSPTPAAAKSASTSMSVSESAPLLDESRKPAKAAASLIEPHPSPDSSSSSIPSEPDLPTSEEEGEKMETLSRKSQWIALALASGGCAAFNGVFAKLTTTELTTSFATWLANLLGLGSVEGGVEVVVRAVFFGLNLIFNGIMWTLFTQALARGTSTTQVSILNTSANFMLTAVLGWMIFSESLPPLWFLGAALLVAGNVIIGRREEGEEVKDGAVRGVERQREVEAGSEEGDGLLGEELELEEEDGGERKRRREDEDEDQDVVDLGLEDRGGLDGRGDGRLT